MLRCAGLTQTYLSGGRELTVLKDITFALEDGGFLAIVGPSGSGKTTLLGLLAGLDRPQRGAASSSTAQDLGGMTEDAAGPAPRREGRVRLPVVPAHPHAHGPGERAGAARALRARSADERPRELLARVGLAERSHHYPAQLSGGEQQRVALARAFANRPRILFADEPTGNLDSATGGGIVELMLELNRDFGTTIVLVTHDLTLAGRARRIIRLADGALANDTAA